MAATVPAMTKCCQSAAGVARAAGANVTRRLEIAPATHYHYAL
jgi:hypothetical protein